MLDNYGHLRFVLSFLLLLLVEAKSGEVKEADREAGEGGGGGDPLGAQH